MKIPRRIPFCPSPHRRREGPLGGIGKGWDATLTLHSRSCSLRKRGERGRGGSVPGGGLEVQGAQRGRAGVDARLGALPSYKEEVGAGLFAPESDHLDPEELELGYALEGELDPDLLDPLDLYSASA